MTEPTGKVEGRETRFTITINIDNAAFEDAGAEIGAILRKLAWRLENGEAERYGGLLFDSNGNNVGMWSSE